MGASHIQRDAHTRLRDLTQQRRGGDVPPPPPPPASAKRSDGRARLDELVGVRPDEGHEERSRRIRTQPRTRFTLRHMLTAILILMAALCASLTLLVLQGVNMAALQDSMTADSPSQSADASAEPEGNRTGGSSNGDETEPSDSTAGDDDSAQSSESETTDGAEPSTTVVPDDGLIDLNTADAQELDTLPGVGPAIAQRILDHRASIGRFTSVDQLLDVKGIGMKTLDKMRAQVTVR